MISSAVLGFLILLTLEGYGHRGGGSHLEPGPFPALGFEDEFAESCSFSSSALLQEEQQTTTVRLIPVGESFYELPLVGADLPRTKYTTARTRLVPQLSYPSCARSGD